MTWCRTRAARWVVGLVLPMMPGCARDVVGPSVPEIPAQYKQSYLFDAVDYQSLLRWTVAGTSDTIRIDQLIDDVTVPPGFNAAFWRTAVVDATEAWLTVLRNDVNQRVHITAQQRYVSATGDPPHTARDPALLRIDFVQQFDNSWAGTTSFDVRDREDCFYLCRIKIALADSAGRPFSSTGLRLIAMHEMGHALGIVSITGGTSHSPNAQDLMYTTLGANLRGLSEGDRHTISHLYSLEPRFRNCAGTTQQGLGKPVRRFTVPFVWHPWPTPPAPPEEWGEVPRRFGRG